MRLLFYAFYARWNRVNKHRLHERPLKGHGEPVRLTAGAFILTTLNKSVLIFALSTLMGAAHAAVGSWSTQLPSVLVAMSDRASSSQPIVPPAMADVGDATIGRIYWRYQVPVGVPMNAWLCHSEQCVPLPTMRGATSALAGKQIDGPMHFRFALASGQRPVRVQELQVIVNYQ
ncbi:flagellar protein FlhE [Vreelandella zhaodongensis]|uniref:Flagellar protein FlhE n=1 Tax=Vreelandella zhaodongensis TaxID=1176240 RepID=A0ABX2SV25_VREZH|nr:flagellar protein FlhE [Halomonas zhaodongensis]NYS46020.1 flagellar protein FlhE [Halomonas zhaodongensis]